MPLKIAFTHKNQESIYPGIENNFLKFIEFFTKSGIETHLLDENDNFSDYAMIVLGKPEQPYSPNLIGRLRQYVLDGGKLFVLMRWGGDNRTNNGKGPSNINELFDDIQANNDIVFNRSHYTRRPGLPPVKKWQSLIAAKFYHEKIKFSGEIFYDGGCTFTVKGDTGISICSSESHRIGIQPSWTGNMYDARVVCQNNPVIVYKQQGKGAVLYCGSRWMFSDEVINHLDNSSLFRHLMVLMLGYEVFEENVERRMGRNQRHRLLHGFPMPEASTIYEKKNLASNLRNLDTGNNKKLAVGVICHPMCNPQIRGCGYCTFPHEDNNPKRMQQATKTLIREIEAIRSNYPDMLNRKVSSIYFGGGTANLTPAPLFRDLCVALKENYQVDKSTEITLEGAPAYFTDNKELLSIMRDVFGDADLRISLGIQTFDDEIIAKMGRSRMNRPGSVEEALKITRDLGIRSSADFMFNLPGRGNWDAIKKDLDKVVELGIEHICWYNLVADPAVGSEWSQDPEIQRILPGLEESYENWLRLFEALREYGYKATTLTDFELEKGSNGYYQYEIDLRNPQDVDWLGLGSYAISLISDEGFTKALKYINPCSLDGYIKRQRSYGIPWESRFEYSTYDLKIFWLTRQVKGTSIPKKMYEQIFRNSIVSDFPNEIKALVTKGLLEETATEYKVTPKGFFYADTIAGHFAWMRVNEMVLREAAGRVVKKMKDGTPVEYIKTGRDWYNDARRHFMG